MTRWQGTAPWGLVIGLTLGIVVGFYELVKTFAAAMKAGFGWMVAASVLSWVIVAGVAGGRANPEVLYGMVGPLAVAAVSWIITEDERTVESRAADGRVDARAWRSRRCFSGARRGHACEYSRCGPAPFIASFTSYFIALHMMEALFMRRLFTTAN